jgi:hypothetical protein
MTYQNHPQPRYYAVVAFFAFFVLVMGVEAMLSVIPLSAAMRTGADRTSRVSKGAARPAWQRFGAGWLGGTLLAAAGFAICLNAEWTLNFGFHPEYTFVPAVQKLTRYIDQHPNRKRLLLCISSGDITMISHLPTICDDFGTQDLVRKLVVYQPGWFATWNVIDPGTLEDLHNHYSLEQVAMFHAFDSPDRNMLVLFKLHPLPDGQVRLPAGPNLQVKLPGEKIDIPIE